jgi:hypothetical protein
MKKSIIALAAIVLGYQAANAQYEFPDERFLKDTTLVILEDDKESEYSKNLKYAMDNHWTITKYRYITESVYKKQYENVPNKYFLGKITVEIEYSNSPTKRTTTDIRAFNFIKDKKKVAFEEVGDHPSGMSLQYIGEHPIYKTVVRTHKLDKFDYIFIVKYIQARIKNPYPGAIFGNIKKDKTASAIIAKKTLVITQTELDAYDATEEKIRKIYNGPLKVVTQDELNKYIEKKDPAIVYFRSTELKYIEKDQEVKSEYPRDVGIFDAATGFAFYSGRIEPREFLIFFRRVF